MVIFPIVLTFCRLTNSIQSQVLYGMVRLKVRQINVAVTVRKRKRSQPSSLPICADPV